MLDIKFIRENPGTVKRACELKGIADNTDEILALDARVRELKTITQTKTAEKNKVTREIPTATVYYTTYYVKFQAYYMYFLGSEGESPRCADS